MIRKKAIDAFFCFVIVAIFSFSGTVTLAGGGSETANFQSNSHAGADYLVGPIKIKDKWNKASLNLPKGWYAVVPKQGTENGLISIANYDMGLIENTLPERSSNTFLTDMVKIDLKISDLAGKSKKKWIEGQYRSVSTKIKTDPHEHGANVSNRLETEDASIYLIYGASGTSVAITKPWNAKRMLSAYLYPAETESMEEALAVIENLGSNTTESDGTEKSHDDSEMLRSVRSLLTDKMVTTDDSQLAALACSANSWFGSDNATGVSNSPITINLPFQYLTRWKSGGAGAFFGNYYHNNSCNDYYAIDFNMMNSSCGSYLNDCGQNVYASASGTAYYYNQGSSGLGIYVDVYHSSGIRTRYAHLTNHNLPYQGYTVTNQTIIGWVGTTGNSSGCHLHYGFHKDSQSLCNVSNPCPNGESPSSPQTPKPSPMTTYYGSSTITDGGCYPGPP